MVIQCKEDCDKILQLLQDKNDEICIYDEESKSIQSFFIKLPNDSLISVIYTDSKYKLCVYDNSITMVDLTKKELVEFILKNKECFNELLKNTYL